MLPVHYQVIQDHHSEYPEPIHFVKGTLLTLGERYEGPEGWEDWLFCTVPGHKGGWVPLQILDRVDGNSARAREDYTARELDVRMGERLIGSRHLNGWVWCENPGSHASGWVPLANLRAITP